MTLEDGLTLWGAAHRAPANTPDFFAGFRPDRGGIHIAVAHASERTALPWQESGKQPHAPFEAAELEEAGLSHAFLGHYHVPRDAERHTYPGNPDPLEFGETGDRGAVLATLRPDGSVDRERRSVAVSEVHDLTVTLQGAGHAEEVAGAVAQALSGRAGFVRLTLDGEVAASLALIVLVPCSRWCTSVPAPPPPAPHQSWRMRPQPHRSARAHRRPRSGRHHPIGAGGCQARARVGR